MVILALLPATGAQLEQIRLEIAFRLLTKKCLDFQHYTALTIVIKYSGHTMSFGPVLGKNLWQLNSWLKNTTMSTQPICYLYWKHKSERTDAASASLYSYPRDSNPQAAYKKLQKKFLENFKQLFSADAKLFSKKI